ncbi:hypothetical protein GT347_15535 [Xylophilus rhododendri]|uniref:Acyltransferase 3 domain-containing protein n=1 Tax=Xylophilus rhododendri TaxID=2697032 RepID=A0A857J7Q0_9BURK|nr:hypothetical protein [Xylophilus rhododendri]QHI99263.1 hypothetical protein GT347_15535 [Xylophilus rhododendri]
MPEHSAQRNPAVDIGKGIAMLLVLYGHAIGELYLYGDTRAAPVAAQLKLIYSFHMPVFFLFSGMVHRVRELRPQLRNACALLFTAYIVHVFCWAAGTLYATAAPDWKALVFPLIELRHFKAVIVWFLAALALVQLAYHLLSQGPMARRLAVAAIVLAGFVWAQARASNVFELSALLPGLLFFAVGHRMAGPGSLMQRLGRHDGLVLAALVFTVVSAGWNTGCRWDLAGDCPNVPGSFVALMIAGQYGVLPLFLLTALVGCFAVVGLSQRIAVRLPAGGRALAWVGRRTLQLLVVNGLVIFFLHPWLAGVLAPPGSLWALEAIALTMVAGQLLMVLLFGSLTSLPLRLAKYLAARLPLLRA